MKITLPTRSHGVRATSVALATVGAIFVSSCGREEEVIDPSDSRSRVEMKTSMGTIEIELFDRRAPITVENFLNYVKKGHYDGTVFHRVMADLVVQGGGFAPDEKGVLIERPTDPPIVNEGLTNKLKNVAGAISMARTSDLHSATAQFFLNFKDNPGWDNERSPYTVFGKVVSGMDVIHRIRNVKTGQRNGRQRGGAGDELLPEMPMPNVPVVDVVIESARVIEK